MDPRGIMDPEMPAEAYRSTLEELTDWTQWADRVLVF
jgi:uncharacterized protein involved in oxidation of intracellular sulfur